MERWKGNSAERPAKTSGICLSADPPPQGFVLEKVQEKTLSEVLRVMRREPIAPDMPVKRVPIELTKISHRLL